MEDLNDFLEYITKKYKPKNIEEMLDYAETEAERNQNFKEKTIRTILIRGYVIHLSLMLEEVFNEILSFSGNSSKSYADFTHKTGFIKNVTSSSP